MLLQQLLGDSGGRNCRSNSYYRSLCYSNSCYYSNSYYSNSSYYRSLCYSNSCYYSNSYYSNSYCSNSSYYRSLCYSSSSYYSSLDTMWCCFRPKDAGTADPLEQHDPSTHPTNQRKPSSVFSGPSASTGLSDSPFVQGGKPPAAAMAVGSAGSLGSKAGGGNAGAAAAGAGSQGRPSQQQQQQSGGDAVGGGGFGHKLSSESKWSGAGGSSMQGSTQQQQQQQHGQELGLAGQQSSFTGSADGRSLSMSGGATGGAGGSRHGSGTEDNVLKVLALLQELLGLSGNVQRQPLSKAMALLLLRLSLDWASLTAISSNGQTQLLMGAAVSPEAQRLKGASGSAFMTPTHNMSSSTGVGLRRGTGGMATGGLGLGGAGGGVLELGGGEPQQLMGSGSSIERVANSRSAMAMYAEGVEELPSDWMRLHQNRDIKVSCGGVVKFTILLQMT